MLKTKVGYSTLKDSYAKGKEAAKNANVGMRPKLGMMYCSCNDDVEEVVSGAMSSMKGAPIIGCTSSGMIITNDGIIESEDGFAGLMSFDDKNMNTSFSNFIKFIRILAAGITLLLPGIYVAICSFHQELLPTDLLYSIIVSRENVPFPVILEILLLEISFELIREAGLRVPSPIGPTISIVGALVLGQAAVSAGIVSPILIIVVAITGIASFAVPDYSYSFHLRLYRFIFIFLGYCCGFLGIGLGLFVYISLLCNTNSFGIPYTSGISPFVYTPGHSYFLKPIWKRDLRSNYLNPKKERRQEKIAMKWKYPFSKEDDIK